MSFQAMTWAIEQKCSSSGQKLVLMMLSNHANGHTGRCTPSHKLLAQECCMGVSTLKGHLQALEAAGLIEIIHRSNEGVSLPNQYQLKMHIPGQNLATPRQDLADGWSDSDRGVGQNLATEPGNLNQELNQEENHNNAQGADELPDPFDVFWTEYPKKVGKGAAQRAWAKIKRPKETLEAMLLALAWQKRSEQWTRDGGQYIPNPATYLNQQRWMDEPPTGRMQRQQQRVHHDISAMDYTRGVDNEGRF